MFYPRALPIFVNPAGEILNQTHAVADDRDTKELQDQFNILLLWIVDTFNQIPPGLECAYTKALNS